MQYSRHRLASARRVLEGATVASVLYLAAGCADDPISPAGSMSAPASPALALGDGTTPTSLQSQLAPAKCLTVRGTVAEGAVTELQPCDGGPRQQFVFGTDGAVRIGSTLCLDAFNARGQDGDAVGIWTCHGGSNQRWRMTSVGELRGINDKCVDVTAALPNNGQPIIIWACHGGSNQRWTPSGAPSSPAPAPAPAPPPASCSLVRDWNARPTTPMAKPGYLQPVTEPDFGTRLVRVTGDPGTPIGNGVSGTWPQIAGVSYAKRQAWSADGAYLMIGEMQGAVGGGVALILDGTTYQPVRAAGPAPSYVWHPTVPDILIGVTGTGSVVTYNVRTGAAATRVSVSGYASASLGGGEGNPSEDGRYVPVVATRTSDGRRVVYVADTQLGTKSSDIDAAAQGFGPLDWAGVSPSGSYVLLLGIINGTPQVSKVYNRATMTLHAFWSDNPVGHSDIGRDAAGNDVLFGAATGGAYNARFIARRLDNGTVTPLSPPLSYDWHSSNRNTARWGWGYAITNNITGKPVDAEVYALKLDGSQSIERFGHHRSNITDYEAYPFAVPSPDGKRIAFRSNWGASSGRPVQTYVIDSRQNCP